MRVPRTDLWLAAALTGVALVALAIAPISNTASGDPGGSAGAVVLTLLMTVPVAWRRTQPIPTLVVAGLAAVASVLADHGVSVGTLTVWWLLGSAALHTDRRWTVAIVLVGAVGVFWAVYTFNPLTRDVLALISAAGVGALPPLVGDALRRQRELTAEILRLRAAELEAAAREERVRIARDLHDTVGHHLGAIGLRARAAELDALDGDAEEAGAALAAIGRLSDRALEDTRVLLGVLRTDDEPGLRPTPGLGDLGELVESARLAGVAATVDGEPGELPDAIGTCAYRIVQEALTNVAKHAAPAAAQVVVRRSGGRLSVTVTDDGGAGGAGDGRPGEVGGGEGAAPAFAGAAAQDPLGVVEVDTGMRRQPRPPRGSAVADADGRHAAGGDGGAAGLGLTGMRERARAVGGTVEAAPVPAPGRGWRVHADLPEAL